MTKIIELLLPLAVLGQLNFVSLGNWGGGNGQQQAVATTLKHSAQHPPLSFVVSPGSNFMEGIADLDDSRWVKHFRDVYASPELNLPWMVALGSHDWDANVTAMVLRTNETYGQVTRMEGHNYNAMENIMGPRWTLPNFFWHYTQTFTDTTAASPLMAAPEVSVFFAFIDTKILGQGFPVPGFTERHWEELKSTIRAASMAYDWVFVVGDEAIYSSGRSGGSKYLRNHLRPLLRENLVDAYISGRDRDLEAIEDGSLTHLICGSGSGGSAGRMFSHDGSLFWSSRPGFCYHTLTKNKMTTHIVDGLTGKHLHTLVKNRNVKNDLRTDKLSHLAQIPRVKYIPLPAGIGGAPGAGVLRTPNSLFVIICGTIGLLIASMIASAGAAATNKRIARWSGGDAFPAPYDNVRTESRREDRAATTTTQKTTTTTTTTTTNTTA